ncbi:hypothetical protein D9613_008050 [Agrocybe pediades]|uniref:DUF6534 domain-containing protein n=1 Tax=Agrocybe pediades TaxID=84607 RepID=A0A8H4QMD8_9AGAR|nr:hypothetical protein D9613_008050 [Agrocybe pediades]
MPACKLRLMLQAFTTKAFIDKLEFEQFSRISYLMYIALGSAVVADILIACCLCLFLSRSRTGYKSTDSIVSVLMIYSINSSVLTTVCAAACFITYTIWPKNFTFIGIYFSLSKLFFNSLLAMLNGRPALKKKIYRRSDTGYHFSQASTRPPEFRTSYAPSRRDSFTATHFKGKSPTLIPEAENTSA